MWIIRALVGVARNDAAPGTQRQCNQNKCVSCRHVDISHQTLKKSMAGIASIRCANDYHCP
jgi:hypothetical protein